MNSTGGSVFAASLTGAEIWMLVTIGILLVVLAFLALAETSLNRMTALKAQSLAAEGYRGGDRLAELVREPVMLFLCPPHPGDSVEEQRVVVARRQPGELGTGSVEQHGSQQADLTVDMVGHRLSLTAAPPRPFGHNVKIHGAA